jgi:MFS transporter, DHA1 family, multidrug resistance protein
MAGLAMLAPFSLDTYLPSFPDIAGEFGVGPAGMQQTLSVYLLAFAAMTLVYGPVSDAFGRRRVVLAALVGYVLASVGCALAQSMETFLAMRVAQGMTAGAGTVISRALVRDLYAGNEAQRVMGMMMMMFGAAPAVAPVIGGLLHDLAGWRSVFLFLSLFGVAVWYFTFRRMPETLPPVARVSVAPRFVLASYANALVNPRFMGVTLVFAFAFAGMFLYIAASPELIYTLLGFGVNDFWRLFIPLVSGIILGGWLSGRLADRVAPASMVTAGLIVMGAAVALNLFQALWLPVQGLTAIAPVPLYSLGLALCMPNLTVLALDCYPRQRGMASAMQTFLQLVANGLVAALLVAKLARSLPGLAGGMAGLYLVAVLLWGLWWWCCMRGVSIDPRRGGPENPA